MRRSACFFYFLLAFPLLQGQNAPVPVIREVSFPNLVNVEPGQLRKVSRPYIGRAYSSEAVNELIARLYALEYFDLITAETKTVADGAVELFFKVEERRKINKVLYRGASAGFLSQIRQKVLINTSDDYYYEGILEPEVVRLQEFYREHGFFQASVRTEVEPDTSAANSVVITFIIAEGVRLSVREVSYTGNQALTEAQIRAIPNLKLTGLALFFRPEYNGKAIEEDKALIELFYKKKGYLDFKVQEIREELIEEKRPAEGTVTRFLRLVFVLAEGSPYRLGRITVRGNVLFTTEELLALFGTKTGEVFDYLRFQTEFERLRSLYYDIGYVNNTIDYREEKNSEKQTVSYDITIVERSRALIESIAVSGNEHTAADVILREIPLKAGDVFSRQELLRGVKNLQYLEIFASVVPDVQPGTFPGLLQVIIKVEEKPTVSVNAKLGFSPVSDAEAGASTFPFTVGVQLQDQNFLGRNYSAGIQGEVSFDKQSAGINFFNPRLLGSRWSLGLGFSYTHTGEQQIKQDLDGNGLPDPYFSQTEYQESSASTLAANAGLYDGKAEAHTFSPSVSAAYTWLVPVGLQLGRLQLRSGYAVNLNYLDYDRAIVRPQDPRQRSNYRSFLYGDVFSLSLAFDTRDVPSNPLSGVILSQSFALGGLVPTKFNRYYLTSRTRFDAHLPLVDEPVSENWSFTLGLSFHTAVSMLLPNPLKPEPVYAYENGFAISSFTIGRGWNSDYGELLWDSSITLSWLLVRQVLNLELFGDIIGLWRELKQFKSLSLDDFRFSVGFGPRLTIPQLPLGIYVMKLFRFNDQGSLNTRPEEGFLGNGWTIALHFKIDPY